MLVGIKPTVGRISRYGIIPITADQDTAGPMARTVTDAAILLGELEGVRRPTRTTPPRALRGHRSTTTGLPARDALRGARIGIPRAFFYDVSPHPARATARRPEPEQALLMAEAIEVLRQAGAEVVDPADIPSVLDPDPASNILRWNTCITAQGTRRRTARSSSSTA
jgi:amidase